MPSVEDAWVTQIRKGTLELCILAIVAKEETYGYAIVEQMGGLPGLEVTESTVYPLLVRMASDRLLLVRTQKSPSGPPRRYYRLTPTGEDRLLHLTRTWQAVSNSVERLLDGRRVQTKER